MTRVLCPRESCQGILQEPVELPGGKKQHAYCRECNSQWPGLDGRFDPVASNGNGRQPKPEEKLRHERNRFWRDILGFAVYDLEQGHRPGPGGTRQTLGLPDTLLFGHGLQVWIEYKAGKNTQTDHQKDFQRHVERNGGLYYLVYPETPVKDILEELEGHSDWRDQP